MAAPKNPRGSKSDKEWRDAVRAAVHELRKDPVDGKKIKALRLLARKTVEAALNGDMTAMKEIGDRLDGKATQAVVGEIGGAMKIVVETGVPPRAD